MKKCWIPLNYNVKDTAAMVELFEKLAEKGWHFHKLNESSVVFVKGEKQSCRYTVDIFSQPRNNKDDEKLSEYRDLCAHSGWEYVDGYKEFQVFKAMPEINLVPLQSDDELANEITHQQQLRSIKSKIRSILSLIVLAILCALLFPLDPLEDDLFLIILLSTLIFGCIYVIWQGYNFIRIRKIIKDAVNYPVHRENHLLLSSVVSIIVTVVVYGGSLLFVAMKFIHQENLKSSVFVIIALVNMAFLMFYQKRNEGRKLKTGKSIMIFALSFIGCTILFSILQRSLPQLPIDQSRVIRMSDPTVQGTFTKGSSYFIPYQCEFVSESGNYEYNLYIAKDLKTSELVFNAVLAKNMKGNSISKILKDELEPVDERFLAEGYYLNNNTELIFHIDNCVIVIKGGWDNSMGISRFNKQLSQLNLSY